MASEKLEFTYDGMLRPTTSEKMLAHRYRSRPIKNYPGIVEIAPGPYGASFGNLPKEWASFVHPEGSRYFMLSAPFKAVTFENLYDEETFEKVARWCSYIEQLSIDRNVFLPDSSELYVQLEEDGGCLYYFIDHASRTQFWIESVDTYNMEIWAPVSQSNLKPALEELYWQHREAFPCHLPITLEVIDYITISLIQGRFDRVSSQNSAFPWSIEQCNQYLETLKSAREYPDTPDTCWIVARLAAVWAHHRWFIAHGEEVVRLEVTNRIFKPEDTEVHTLGRLLSLSLFNLPEPHRQRLEDQFADGFSYVDRWTAAMDACLKEWKLAAGWGLGMLVACVLMMLVPGAIKPLGVVSLLACATSVLSAMLLYAKHEPIRDVCCEISSEYLENAKHSKLRYSPRAALFALPMGMAIWTTIFVILHALLLVVPLPSFSFVSSAFSALVHPVSSILIPVHSALFNLWTYHPAAVFVLAGSVLFLVALSMRWVLSRRQAITIEYDNAGPAPSTWISFFERFAPFGRGREGGAVSAV